MKKVKIFDISMLLKNGMVTYPNNPEFAITEIEGRAISRISFGSHTGTHLDAPKHAISSNRGVESFNLERFFGPCRVIDFTHIRDGITLNDLKQKKIKTGERILVKTKNSRLSLTKFSEKFVYLEPEAAEYLGSIKIVLFGTDYLSVKKRGAENNRSHTELLSRGIPIIEGLRLASISPGTYTLSAFPLSMPGADGSPLRAILISKYA